MLSPFERRVLINPPLFLDLASRLIHFDIYLTRRIYSFDLRQRTVQKRLEVEIDNRRIFGLNFIQYKLSLLNFISYPVKIIFLKLQLLILLVFILRDFLVGPFAVAPCAKIPEGKALIAAMCGSFLFVLGQIAPCGYELIGIA
jgi:hypothetical protein